MADRREMTLLFPLCTRLSSPPTPRSGVFSVGPVRELLARGKTCRRTQCKLERWWKVESSDSSRRRHRTLLSVVCSSSRRRSDVVIASSSRRRIVVAQAFNEKPRRNWWQRLLFQRIDNWQNTKLEDEEDEDLEILDYEENAEEEDYVLSDAELDFDLMEEEEEEEAADMDEIDSMIEDDAKFEAWKRKRDVLNELREFQETGRDPDGLEWEDWLDDSWRNGTEDGVGGKDGGWFPFSCYYCTILFVTNVLLLMLQSIIIKVKKTLIGKPCNKKNDFFMSGNKSMTEHLFFHSFLASLFRY